MGGAQRDQRRQSPIGQDVGDELLVAATHQTLEVPGLGQQPVQATLDRLLHGSVVLVAAAAGIALLGPSARLGAGLDVGAVHLGLPDLVTVRDPDGVGRLAPQDDGDPPLPLQVTQEGAGAGIRRGWLPPVDQPGVRPVRSAQDGLGG